MQLPKDSGIELLDKIVRRSMRYYSDLFQSMSGKPEGSHDTPHPLRLPGLDQLRLPTLDSLKGPVGTLLNNLGSAVTQFSVQPDRTNYHAVVRSFLPPGARLIGPQYPEGSGEIQFADLDGDTRSELVASYKIADGIGTMILKRDEIHWYKLAEIYNPGFESIHYRNAANMTGDGKNLFFLGLEAKTGARAIHAYSIEDGDAKKLFSKRYHLIDLQKPSGRFGSSAPASLALWNETSPGIYDIELARWNGLGLEQQNSSRYLSGRVVPYYIRKLRQNPKDTFSWYNLANTMARTGDKANAKAAARIGLERNPDAVLKEKLQELQNRL